MGKQYKSDDCWVVNKNCELSMNLIVLRMYMNNGFKIEDWLKAYSRI